MRWYIIYRVWRVDGVLHFAPLDAVLCECAAAAVRYAKARRQLANGESMFAEACLTLKEIHRAKALHNQHAIDDQVNDWTDADWKEFCDVPTYSGDQDKYMRA